MVFSLFPNRAQALLSSSVNFRTVLGREMVGIIIPILQLSKIEAVCLLTDF